MEKEKTIFKCSALYNYTNIRSDDRVFPCCRFKRPIQKFDGDVNSVLASNEYDELREKFKTQKLPECSKCWEEEDNGIKSLREEFNEQYSCDEIKLRHLEIGFDNICNLKCDPCWEEWSFQFNGIIKHIKPLKNVPELEKVTFLGGEPLMTQKHYQLLKRLNRKNLEVIYVTNGMFKPKEKWKIIWRECKQVSFLVSIDGYGELNEKVRSGSDWNTIINNIEELEKEWFVTINTVLHKNNEHGLDELKKWVGNRKWNVNLLTYPEHLKIGVNNVS